MAIIQIGKFKRPGIFIQEFENSIITTPTVEGIATTVVGFSRKGPVNTPILLKNVSDLEAIYGPLDRNLERKGSYFHRTVSKMLESSPVYAMNLLATDDTLDKVEYISLSTDSSKSNDVERTGPYRRFFDTTGFWKRDTESFINLTKPNVGYNDRLMSFTNLSDKFVTVFVFKSTKLGFDRTLIEWYGSAEKVPTYTNQTDFASDYMVDVVIVGGDWSNYNDLSVDPRWSKYFNNTGLRKEQVTNFANDKNVSLLNFYSGLSLIPYFRDSNNTNIFIETVINRDTDKTGLYCAFNSDLLEQDFPTGLIDLIGNNLVSDNSLVDTGATDVNFLSYKDTIVESILFSQTLLDRAGNVTAIDGTASFSGERSGLFAEGIVSGLNYNSTNSVLNGTSSVFIEYTSGVGSYAVIGGINIPVTGGTFSLNSNNYPLLSTTASFVSTFVLNTSGNVTKVDNLVNSDNPVVGATDIVLGYLTVQVKNKQFVGTVPSIVPVTVDGSGYVKLVSGTSSDYTITDLGSGSIKVEFVDTASTIATSSYVKYRKLKLFNNLINLLNSPNKNKMTMVIDFTTKEKRSLENMTITSIVTDTTQNKSFVLNTGLTTLLISDILSKQSLLLYTVDDELIIKTTSLTTKNTTSTSTDGIVAKYSNLYKKYFTGLINTGDFFYENVSAVTTDVTFANVLGSDYIVFSVDPALNNAQTVIIPDSTLNKGSFVVSGVIGATSIGGHTGYFYQVSQSTVAETLTGVSTIYDANIKHYLEMYLDSLNNLNVFFKDNLLQSAVLVDPTLNSSFRVKSDKSNFKETVEIELPSGYIQIPNKILVNGTRYTNVKVGDFLEAYVDETTLKPGQVGKRLTRILGKKLYAGDTTLVEITCDSRISKVSFNGDLQTMRYTSVDNYASTYKAIVLTGFRVRLDSMPDGTESKQKSILDIVAKGTPLFKALTNKEAFDFRYLTDSFGLGLTERSKQQLVDICGERLDCFGFINMPSLKQFKNSSSPSFVNSEGVLSAEFISKGGDPESSPAFLYSFGEGIGTTSAGYFLPYLTVNDNGRPLEVPPAMFVATTYMRKHNTNITSIVPWTISAGVTNGKITGIASLEHNFDPEDIEFLNQAQMNPIVLKRNRGYVIETENTAQTLVKSSLSYIHSREVLIELERQLSAMLLDFQWKNNTPEVRSELKMKADVICETFVSKNGLFNFFNKCDEENNTSDLIDNQIGVLDTFCEITKGFSIIVNNITILRTGAIKSGGFQ